MAHRAHGHSPFAEGSCWDWSPERPDARGSNAFAAEYGTDPRHATQRWYENELAESLGTGLSP
jgi:hypothetical protein